jgi:CoA:oxalate CoA-transferase
VKHNNNSEIDKPLEGLLVLDFSQFLSGPSAALRLADLGARVIKIERDEGGDICRKLYISNHEVDGDSTLFHSINRNKESFAVNLKNPTNLEIVKQLIKKADIMINNFRPNVMAKLGLSYEEVNKINPRIIYGEVTGYGTEGQWKDKPGQDLLIQSLSGLAFLNGNGDCPPQPFGLAIADMMTGAHLVQGILACLIQQGMTGIGAKVEVSLLESILDVQFDVFSMYINDEKMLPQRSVLNNAHAYQAAPYGIYETMDGYIALANVSVSKLGEVLACPALTAYIDQTELLTKRDEIKTILIQHLKTETTQYWIEKLERENVLCSEVLNWTQLLEHEGFKTLQMVQQIKRKNNTTLKTTRCPIRIDGNILTSEKGAPKIGEDNEMILQEFIKTKVW